MLETSHPPNFYIPASDTARGVLVPAGGGTVCECKGRASYLDVVDGERVQPQAGGFHGGWITANVLGPFKGHPGTSGW